MDRREFREGDRPAFLDALERWDRIFAVLEDTDHAKLRQFSFIKTQEVTAAGFAPSPPEVATVSASPNGYTSPLLIEMLPDEEIESQVAERNAARRKGDFSRADQIRQNLVKAGVILEDTKAGTRWKRR
jgi:cysteinyl-tRNA synthetase